MRAKGRLQRGCDADLVVFDPQRITETSTYQASTRPSGGIAHVLVNGVHVVRDGQLVDDAFPGRPIYARSG
jgi:N-acyl-D-aspartate/D-glutamate deacylase